MAPKQGDTVRVHYRGTLDDGTEFDSSSGRDPLEFTIGEGQVIPGFESAVSDLEVGGTTTVTIPAGEAYGQRVDEAMQTLPRESFGEMDPEPGWAVELQAPDGTKMTAVVAEVRDTDVVLDFNHPLAGEDLTFELELVGMELP